MIFWNIYLSSSFQLCWYDGELPVQGFSPFFIGRRGVNGWVWWHKMIYKNTPVAGLVRRKTGGFFVAQAIQEMCYAGGEGSFFTSVVSNYCTALMKTFGRTWRLKSDVEIVILTDETYAQWCSEQQHLLAFWLGSRTGLAVWHANIIPPLWCFFLSEYIQKWMNTMLCFHEHVKRYRVILRDFRNPGFPFETMPIHHIFPKVLVQGVPKKLTAKADREVGPFQPQHSSLDVMSTCRPNCCHSEWTQKRGMWDVGYECGWWPAKHQTIQ